MKKRILSPLLSLCLCVSLAVPASAAEGAADPTRFTDAAQIEHWEAVAALCKLGVMEGKDDGAFHPEDTLTRAEAAKLIVTMLDGGEGLTSQEVSQHTFSDTQGHWAEPYIERCVSLGILSGRGDGTFDPNNQVTTLELLKIALAVLGYDPSAYRLTGSDWAEETDTLARRTALYTGLSGVSLNQPVSRDNAAQILYNVLGTTPNIVVPSQGDGLSWRYEYATRDDGSPSSFLYERFGLDAVEDLPAQPQG